MSDEYTPTTDQVRNAYENAWVGDGSHVDTDLERLENAQDFDRWLAAHDAEVAATAKAEQREADVAIVEELIRKLVNVDVSLVVAALRGEGQK